MLFRPLILLHPSWIHLLAPASSNVPLFFFSILSLCIPAGSPPLIRSLSTEPHVSESIRAESRRGRSFTEVNIKLRQAPRRKRRGEKRGREGALRP